MKRNLNRPWKGAWGRDSIDLLRDSSHWLQPQPADLGIAPKISTVPRSNVSVPDYSYPAKIASALGKEQPPAVPAPDKPAVLTPNSAFRILNKLTHGSISRATFYRWLSSGRVFSYRVGYRLYVPMSEIEDIVKRCREGRNWS